LCKDICKKFFDYVIIHEDQLVKAVYFLIGTATGITASIIMFEMGIPTGL